MAPLASSPVSQGALLSDLQRFALDIMTDRLVAMTKHHKRHSHDTPEVTDALWDEWMAQLTAELSGTDDECDLREFRENYTALPALFMTERAYAEWYREYTHFVQSAREDDAYRARVVWGIG